MPVELIRRCDELGYHVVWTAEAYGSDALSPLAYLAAVTDRIKLGTAVVQIAARTPAATAMHAMTIDALAGGNRTIIGLGVSGPQIVEGWYGRPWGKPNAMLRDYVAIMRKVLRREAPVEHDGSQISLPYTGPGSIGQGKPLKSILHPNPGIEIWLASGAPLNTALCAEVADGWLPMGYGPDGAEVHGPALEKGFAKRDPREKPRDQFEIFTNISVEITDDVQAVLDRQRPLRAMYVGGMGSSSHNYHRDAMARAGFADEADRIQELFLAGRKEEAIAAMPDEYLEQGALYGSVDRIRRRFEGAVPAGATGVTIRTAQPEAVELMAELAGTRDQPRPNQTRPNLAEENQ
ncbi:MAG: LLM class F420-dependent oxidoreductase [Acidimicrobiales bacterium]|nr:LLM class F420-dependent oxidoreductase [Acidimicrobiales bacterium]